MKQFFQTIRLKYILILIICFFIASGSIWAQKNNNIPPEERAERITHWMDKNFNLTQEQYENIRELNSEYARINRKLNKEYKDSRLKLIRKLKRSNRRKERELRNILNDDQWDIYEKRKEKLMNSVVFEKSAPPEPTMDHITIHRNKVYDRHSNAETYLNALDIYTNSYFANAPVVLFVHGGGWRMGDKRQRYSKLPTFVDSGYVFVTINYRLSPNVKHPAHVKDLSTAIDWVHQNISNYGGNPRKIILIGHSAGANMVAQVSTDHSYLQNKNTPISIIKGVIALDGAGYNVTTIFKSDERRMKRVYKQAFGKDPEVWHNASPVNHITKNKPIPPTMLVYAGQRALSARAAKSLAQQLEDAGTYTQLKHYPHDDHSSINRQLGNVEHKITSDVLEFIEKALEMSLASSG